MHEHFVYNVMETHGKCGNPCETDGKKQKTKKYKTLTLTKNVILFFLVCIVTVFTLIFVTENKAF